MVISQVIGRGAPELTRFWGEPPLVREPDVALFGYERLDPPEEQFLLQSPLRRHPALEVFQLRGQRLRRGQPRLSACLPRSTNSSFISI